MPHRGVRLDGPLVGRPGANASRRDVPPRRAATTGERASRRGAGEPRLEPAGGPGRPLCPPNRPLPCGASCCAQGETCCNNTTCCPTGTTCQNGRCTSTSTPCPRDKPVRCGTLLCCAQSETCCN